MTIGKLLDTAAAQLVQGDGDTLDIVHALAAQLTSYKLQTGMSHWSEFARSLHAHFIAELLREDPYTRRAWIKPRGYAGDAELMDFLYGNAPPSETSLLGQKIYSATVRSASGLAVAERRKRLGRLVSLASRKPSARILSVGCGHLREAECLEWFKPENVLDWIAVDQDAQSLEEVCKRYGHLGIRTLRLSIQQLAGQRRQFEKFDLIYAAGLYDYFGKSTAAKMTKILASMLSPDGLLSIANFADDNKEQGYMEAFMDWWLVYRNEKEMEDLGHAAGLDFTSKVQRDETGTLLWLDICRN